MSHDEFHMKEVKIIGDESAKSEYPPKVAYRRYIHTKLITFTCAQCKKSVTQWRYPSPGPKYCGDECKDEAEREKSRERSQRYRDRKKQGKISPSS